VRDRFDPSASARVPWVTILLIAVNAAIFLAVQRPYDRGLNQARFTYQYAAIPCELTRGRPLTGDEVTLTLSGIDTHACQRVTRAHRDQPVFPSKLVLVSALYSMFLHGSWLHIGGNMLFLWLFGPGVERRMGSLAFLGFYLVSGLVATGAHIAVQPSATVPIVGASGAIAGVMGAYLVLFPNNRLWSPDLPVVGAMATIRAKWFLGFWFVLQFFTNPAEGVAWVAHVGGFLFGVMVALVLGERLRPAPAPSAAPAG
jgi:membrane associated rhomboid family serine protease